MIADTLTRFFAAHDIRGPLVVAVSGGGDSTALLVALAELETIEFTAAHINHKLRAAESDADEAFVRDLCARYSVPLQVAAGPLDDDRIRREGVEAAARAVRYAALHNIRASTGASHIVTAHQKNDQAETVLMRLLTGAGIAALRGIHPIRSDGVIRPLLSLTRRDLDAFLEQRRITPRADRSNADPRFLRNRVRAILTGLDPAVIDNLASVAEQAREQWRVLEQAIDAADTSITTDDETRFTEWPEDPWLRRALLHRHVRRLDPAARDVSAADLHRLANDTAKRISVTSSVELIRRGGETILRRRPQNAPPFAIALRPGESAAIERVGRISLRPASDESHGGQRFQLPRGSDATFIVRNRRDGDRFQPLGMSRQKKLKDFLIDRKIPAEFRDRIPLLVWNGTIVWVGGVEISEAFKVHDGAGELYEVSIDQENQEGLQRESDRESRRQAGQTHPLGRRRL